jgi:septal ring factor EnvC (AmiA/AmiB activator)
MIKVEAEISKARKGVAGVNSKLKKEKDRMGGLVKSKRAAYRQAAAKNESTRAEIKKLVAESKTIEEFLRKAEDMRRRRDSDGTRVRAVSRKFAGKVPMPVVGRIAAYFGDKRAAGVKSKGLYIQAKRGAQVVSPLDASVVFAGSFYGYRNLLILRNTDGYYVIMGGMDDVLAGEGQNLLAGEPVGEAGSGELYVEVRENEKPVDPLSYFKV